MAPHVDTSRARLQAAVVLGGSLLLAPLGGCSSRHALEAADCVSPFHFRDQVYVFGPQPPDGKRVKPGVRLGEGANESCDQYAPGEHMPGDGSDRLTEPRPVYAYPAVPTEQAILLVTPDGRHAAVLLAADKPAEGWDPQLRSWLNSRTAR